MSALPTAWPSINSGVEARRFLGGADTVENEAGREGISDLEIIIRIKPIDNEIIVDGGGVKEKYDCQVLLNFRQFACYNDYVAAACIMNIFSVVIFFLDSGHLILQRDPNYSLSRNVYERSDIV